MGVRELALDKGPLCGELSVFEARDGVVLVVGMTTFSGRLRLTVSDVC